MFFFQLFVVPKQEYPMGEKRKGKRVWRYDLGWGSKATYHKQYR